MEILQGIPGYVVLLGIIGVASTQAVILWRLSALEKKFDNGISRDIKNLDNRVDAVEKECIKHHAKERLLISP